MAVVGMSGKLPMARDPYNNCVYPDSHSFNLPLDNTLTITNTFYHTYTIIHSYPKASNPHTGSGLSANLCV
jgi:hypothetical protein